ncbi:MAG TPA: DUF5615 family PIN-like protein [Candidatus Ozemobacteraceae bacterium]|nr:DUF5615 family PIN-like protein [Candidatus Ozemobacteraceae bacterium]
MRFLADENFPGGAVYLLKNAGHDVAWICADTPGSKDQEVLARAVSESRILLTFDKDFGELAFRSRLPASCGVILFRCSLESPEIAMKAIVDVICSRDDWAGFFAVVEAKRIRLRALP